MAGRADVTPAAGEPSAATAWLVVDVMNVVGSRPDGWWRDRAGAVDRLVARLRAHAGATGRAVTAVVDADRGPRDDGHGPGLVEVVLAGRAPDAADDAIVALVSERGGPVTVVTADRRLRERVAALDATTIGPRTLLDGLERTARVPDGGER